MPRVTKLLAPHYNHQCDITFHTLDKPLFVDLSLSFVSEQNFIIQTKLPRQDFLSPFSHYALNFPGKSQTLNLLSPFFFLAHPKMASLTSSLSFSALSQCSERKAVVPSSRNLASNSDYFRIREGFLCHYVGFRASSSSSRMVVHCMSSTTGSIFFFFVTPNLLLDVWLARKWTEAKGGEKSFYLHLLRFLGFLGLINLINWAQLVDLMLSLILGAEKLEFFYSTTFFQKLNQF